QRHINLYSFRSGNLGKRLQLNPIQHVPQQQRDPCTGQDVHALTWIEVENNFSWPFDVRFRRQKRVNLQRAYARSPYQSAKAVDHDIMDLRFAAASPHGKAGDPIGRECRGVFFVEELPRHFVRVTLERDRTILQVRQGVRCNPYVVVDDIALGKTNQRIDDPVSVEYADSMDGFPSMHRSCRCSGPGGCWLTKTPRLWPYGNARLEVDNLSNS